MFLVSSQPIVIEILWTTSGCMKVRETLLTYTEAFNELDRGEMRQTVKFNHNVLSCSAIPNSNLRCLCLPQMHTSLAQAVKFVMPRY